MYDYPSFLCLSLVFQSMAARVDKYNDLRHCLA